MNEVLQGPREPRVMVEPEEGEADLALMVIQVVMEVQVNETLTGP